MLYRWQMEHRRGELKENKHVKPAKPSPKLRPDRSDPAREAEDRLAEAHKRIKKPEKHLMRNFVILVQGENFNLEIDGEFQTAGFFASRRAEADTEDEASNLVITQLLTEPEIKGKELPGYTMIVKVAHEMPLKHKNTYSGFTFFPMEEV